MTLSGTEKDRKRCSSKVVLRLRHRWLENRNQQKKSCNHSKQLGTHFLLLCVCGRLELHCSSCVCAAGGDVCLDLNMCETQSVGCTVLTHSASWPAATAQYQLTQYKIKLVMHYQTIFDFPSLVHSRLLFEML